MKFVLPVHQNKGEKYRKALLAAGFEETCSAKKADFLMLDHPYGPHGKGIRKPLMDAAQRGIPCFLYPHAARPQVVADIYAWDWPWKHAFVATPEHEQMLRSFGIEYPITPVGWHLTDIRPFLPGEWKKPLKVCFAPLHCNANGYLDPIDRWANKRTHDLLLSLIPDIELYVRCVFKRLGGKEIKNYGFEPDGRADYFITSMGTNDGLNDILAADLVVSHQTFAWMAVALGKPTLMYHDIAGHSGDSYPLMWAENHHKYVRELRYPLEVDDYPTPEALRVAIKCALHGSDVVEDWKRRMIGKPFDAELMVETVKANL